LKVESTKKQGKRRKKIDRKIHITKSGLPANQRIINKRNMYFSTTTTTATTTAIATPAACVC
jgi:hypothetical protein